MMLDNDSSILDSIYVSFASHKMTNQSYLAKLARAQILGYVSCTNQSMIFRQTNCKLNL